MSIDNAFQARESQYGRCFERLENQNRQHDCLSTIKEPVLISKYPRALPSALGVLTHFFTFFGVEPQTNYFSRITLVGMSEQEQGFRDVQSGEPRAKAKEKEQLYLSKQCVGK